MKVRPAAEAEKRIDKNDVTGNFAIALTPCGHRSDKNRIFAANYSATLKIKHFLSTVQLYLKQ
jgi:hypothetical protein